MGFTWFKTDLNGILSSDVDRSGAAGGSRPANGHRRPDRCTGQDLACSPPRRRALRTVGGRAHGRPRIEVEVHPGAPHHCGGDGRGEPAWGRGRVGRPMSRRGHGLAARDAARAGGRTSTAAPAHVRMRRASSVVSRPACVGAAGITGSPCQGYPGFAFFAYRPGARGI
jgi:hypothetical protein